MKKSLIVLFNTAYTVLQLFLLRLLLFISGQARNIFKMEGFLWKNKCHSPAYKEVAQKPGWATPVLRIVILTGLL